MLILPLFTIACSEQHVEETTETAYKSKSMKKLDIAPENIANPYDSAGIIHNEILEILENIDFTSMSIEDITILIDSVSATHPELILLANDITLSSRVTQITAILDQGNPLSGVLVESNLGVSAKASFSTFLSSLLLVANSPYEDIHPIIVTYEATVLSNTVFSANDKRIILTASSVARYSIAERKRKDKDWETSVTNIIVAAYGAESNTTLGIKMAATVGICKSNNISQ
ncbi:hypothetical protein [Flavobacterium sp. T12S277]|uniref:hypothetical protein n=1 Tax=Flavobacterium sp. T12S277 TaxID=3402752 RepID=UPI003AED7BCF